MRLSASRVEAIIAVSDMEKAKAFYEGKLGLSDGEDQGDGGCTYRCGGETTIHIYPSPFERRQVGSDVGGVAGRRRRTGGG
jgi:catechol 2,3-dioxygenase-like lactoylglutathione lyase family enzyme